MRWTINHLRLFTLIVAFDLVITTRWLAESPQFDRRSRLSYLASLHLLALVWFIIVRNFMGMTAERSRSSMISMGVVWTVFLLPMLPILARILRWTF